MKAIMVMFDSLNKRYLESYGSLLFETPNFKRLSERCVTFDSCFAGSLPCMPARRELHTGRYNFLHRSWGPLEPFDDSMPEILKNNDIYTHLVTDHHLYWADGGATYHSRYSSWEMIRGQEGDPWKGEVLFPEIPSDAKAPNRLFLPSREKLSDIWRQEWVNRKQFKTESDYPQSKTFVAGLEFIDNNYNQDNWFLQIESFDPHEPYVVAEEYDKLYLDKIKKPNLDWPDYHPVTENKEDIENLKFKYGALLSKCDKSLGEVLDKMDKYDMWKDTMLIVCTDHGFLLGEHGWWAKNMMPSYNELVNIPLFIWDPTNKIKGERRNALVQTIDIAPTILDFFNLEIPKDMQGKSLRETIVNDKKIRDYCLYGWHGNQINCTDGRYVYMRGLNNIDNDSLYEYTLMPTHIKSRFTPEELKTMELVDGFSFTKDCKVLKIKVSNFNQHFRFGTKLYDTLLDPCQIKPIDDIDIEIRMCNAMVKLMKESDSPLEQYKRVGLYIDREIDANDIIESRDRFNKLWKLDEELEQNIEWDEHTKELFAAFVNIVNFQNKDLIMDEFKKEVNRSNSKKINIEFLESFITSRLENTDKVMAMYYLNLLSKQN